MNFRKRVELTLENGVAHVQLVRADKMNALDPEMFAAILEAGSFLFEEKSARCVVLLRLAGMAARPCPPPPGWAASGWRRRWWWRLREVAALPWDAGFVVWLRVVGRL